MKKLKLPLTVFLLVLIVGFAYVDYETVSLPIRFEKEKTKRYTFVIENLKDIRTAQLAYKDKHSVFADNFDKLIEFVKMDSMDLVRNMGSFNEDTLTEERAIELGIILTKLPDTLTAELAVQRGFVVRDTIKISVLDSIFPTNYQIDSLKYIPFSGGKEFKLGATEIKTGSGVTVQVFEAVDVYPFDKWDTLKVGSLIEANNNSGNWE